MKIVDVKCAVIGYSPVVRIITDAGIVGHGEAEATKAYLKPHISLLQSVPSRRGSDRCRTGHDENPPDGQLQALGQRRQCDRNGAMGHCRESGRFTRL